MNKSIKKIHANARKEGYITLDDINKAFIAYYKEHKRPTVTIGQWELEQISSITYAGAIGRPGLEMIERYANVKIVDKPSYFNITNE